MQEAFKVLTRAKQDAERRLRQYQEEGRKSEHKLLAVRHAIRELEQALDALSYMYEQRTILVRLWSLVEEGNRNVQVHGDTGERGGRVRGTSRRP